MCRHVSVIFLYSVCTLRPTDVKLWNSSMLYHTACLQAYNLPWAMGEISFGYSLITGDLGLPAYNLPCSVSHLFSLITYHGTCAFAFRQWPNALCISSTAAGLNWCSEFIKRAVHLVKCCAFCQCQMRCAFDQMCRLIKCTLLYHFFWTF